MGGEELEEGQEGVVETLVDLLELLVAAQVLVDVQHLSQETVSHLGHALFQHSGSELADDHFEEIFPLRLAHLRFVFAVDEHGQAVEEVGGVRVEGGGVLGVAGLEDEGVHKVVVGQCP